MELAGKIEEAARITNVEIGRFREGVQVLVQGTNAALVLKTYQELLKVLANEQGYGKSK